MSLSTTGPLTRVGDFVTLTVTAAIIVKRVFSRQVANVLGLDALGRAIWTATVSFRYIIVETLP